MNLLEDTNQGHQPQIDPNKNYLEELVGEGKKFKTVEDLARGKAESDLYIEHKNRAQDELRAAYMSLQNEYNSGQSLKELIDQLKPNKESQNENTHVVPEDKSAQLDMKQIEELIRSNITATKQMEKEEANFASVQTKLKEAYGDNYANTLKQQISDLGLTADFVNDLARKHPQVLYRTLGLDGQRQNESFQAPPASKNRSDPFAPNVAKRSWSYYEKMRKSNPSEYFNPKTQDQMFKDATTLGAAFNDGDFQQRLIQY